MDAASYQGASAHYTSASRRDAVKRHGEERASAAVLAGAVGRVGAPKRPGRLAVLDVGAGTGDGLALLRKAIRDHGLDVGRIDYLGLDTDPEMVETARALHADDPGAAFDRHDLRVPRAYDPVDLVMSAGVPWSHLTEVETRGALATLFGATRTHGPTVHVVDVLGRYSVEWPDRWAQRRWSYAMSFFSGTAAPITSDMTFYGRDDLDATVTAAARDAGAEVRHAEFHDRAVAVGRHTGTRTFNDAIPPYRTLVNELFDGATDGAVADLDELAFTPPVGAAPADVHAFFAAFSRAWNARLAEAADHERRVGATADTRRALAWSLCRLEHDRQRGLGAGHSLTGVFVVA